MRIGHGYDAHRFGAGDFVTLGGVRIPHPQGLEAHSDGDVLLHALSDALLGAAALGDIGKHFPDTDPRWKGADSMTLLRHVATLLAEDGWRVANIDCAVVCERPKLAPRRDEIVANLTGVVGAPVNVKGNRAERLGAIGREEGVVGGGEVGLEGLEFLVGTAQDGIEGEFSGPDEGDVVAAGAFAALPLAFFSTPAFWFWPVQTPPFFGQ